MEFGSDHKVYPADQVEQKEIYDFWKDDVVAAFKKWVDVDQEDEKGSVVKFLNEINHQYKLRWERDPETGEGATTKSRVVYRRAAYREN